MTPPTWHPRTYTVHAAAVAGSDGERPPREGADPSAPAADTPPGPPHRGPRRVPKILRDRRILATVAVLAALAVAGSLVPTPSISQVRDWAESMGPAFVLVFFLAQALVTIAPVPRTVFTLSAGLLFGPVAGVAVAIAATTVSAVLALLRSGAPR